MKPAFPSHVEINQFASVAEAVAHYYKQGFSTFDESEKGERKPWRVMRKYQDDMTLEAFIRHDALLTVNSHVSRLC